MTRQQYSYPFKAHFFADNLQWNIIRPPLPIPTTFSGCGVVVCEKTMTLKIFQCPSHEFEEIQRIENVNARAIPILRDVTDERRKDA